MWINISLNFRSTKFLELMDNAEKAIEKVNADQIYTSKQFMRIRDDFYVSLIEIQTRDRYLFQSFHIVVVTICGQGL